tara:strand:+ start:348 stop:677 length:330 start_codon:yes stop_codon:yes gene_type:complete
MTRTPYKSWQNKIKENQLKDTYEILWDGFNKVVNSEIANKLTQSPDLEKDLQTIGDMFIQHCRTNQVEKYIILKSKQYNVLKKLIHCYDYKRIGLVVSQLQRCGTRHKE